VIEERGSGNVLQSTYTYGPGIDEVLTMNRNSQTFFYFYDGLGSVTDLTNAAGELVESYQYDVYGQPTTPSTVGNPYLFTGRQLDPETNLYYYRSRYYHPGIGRFLNREQEPTDFNLYRYVLNSPTNWIDPWGLTTLGAQPFPINGQDVIGGQGLSIPVDIAPPSPLPPTEWTPPIHEPPGPDVLPQPAPGGDRGGE